MPRVVSLSGQKIAGSLLFEPEERREAKGTKVYIHINNYICIYIYVCIYIAGLTPRGVP